MTQPGLDTIWSFLIICQFITYSPSTSLFIELSTKTSRITSGPAPRKLGVSDSNVFEYTFIYSQANVLPQKDYYRQIQEAADQAPTVRTKEGDYVKYVQIAGQPYPIALPVTFTRTPGGGQTQRVDPIKIKWSDIFKPSKF